MPPSTVVVNGKAFVFVFVFFGGRDREEGGVYLNLMHGVVGGVWGRRQREKTVGLRKDTGGGVGIHAVVHCPPLFLVAQMDKKLLVYLR